MQKQQFETVYEINGMQLACQRITNQSVKVIALHGWQDNSNSFLPIMSELSHFDGMHSTFLVMENQIGVINKRIITLSIMLTMFIV